MSDLSSESLLKCFYLINERLESFISIHTNSNKKKKCILALTVSLSAPIEINIYTVKLSDKGDIKRKLVSSAKNLSSVNCHDYDGLPSYDIEFKCVDGNLKRIFAHIIADKHRFIERLMRCIYLHDLILLNNIQFDNLPASININDIYSEGNSDKTDDKTDQEPEETNIVDPDATDFSRYRNISKEEETNMLKFLNESPDAVINAMEFQETLKQHLMIMESINVQSVISSEKQFQVLMSNIDGVITRLETLETKIGKQDQILTNVEESMTSLHDRDELVRLTSHNKDLVQATLEQILHQLTLDEMHVYALHQIDFYNHDSLQRACTAADQLLSLLEQSTIEGTQHMDAYQQKITELNELTDTFARKVTTHVNNVIMKQSNKLMMLAINEFDMMLDMHRVTRIELSQYADLVHWLYGTRLRSFHELKKVYMDKISSIYEQEMDTMMEIMKNRFFIKNRNVSGNTNRSSIHHANKLQDKHRIKNHSESNSVNNGDSDRFDIVFEDFLHKLKQLVIEEEDFVSKLFGLDCRRAKDRPHHAAATDTNMYLIKVSEQIFRHLPSQVSSLIQSLEQQDHSLSLMMVVIVNRQYEDLVRSSEFLQLIWSVLFMQSKRSFNGYIDGFVASFREYKAPKKSRCGILAFVQSYDVFAEQTTLVFQDSEKQNDLISAHQRIVRDIITQIDRVSNESVKTPKEVIVMENHHQMIDILRRLKWPELDELQSELKSKYLDALNSYVICCVGRPFEKLYVFFENVGNAIESGIKMEDIGYMFAFNRNELRKIIHEYPGIEIKKGLEILCKKVEKYVSENSGLFQVIWLSMQKQFMTECLRYEELIGKCYPNSNIKLEFTAAELQQYFGEIAIAH